MLLPLMLMPTEVQLVCCMTFVCSDFIKHVHRDPVKFVSSISLRNGSALRNGPILSGKKGIKHCSKQKGTSKMKKT